MSQSSDVDALLRRFMEVEGERLVPPALTPLTKATTVGSSASGAVLGAAPPPPQPPQKDACASGTMTSPVCRPERSSTASSGAFSSSSSSNDTQADAATPSRRPSRHSTHAVPTPTAPLAHTSPPHASSQGGLAPRASSASPPLSLSHPVVEFLAGVQLQGYAARVLRDLGLRSMAELAARGDSAAHIAELLGPCASLQQQAELWRGLRRWERDEARRSKAAAAEARRRGQEAGRDARRRPRERRTAASTTASTTATRGRHGAVAGTCDPPGPATAPTELNAESGGRQSTLLCAALGSCVGTEDGASFRVPDLCEQPCAPHLVSSGSGTVVTAESGSSAGLASASTSCPSLTVSATQLMRELSYRCAHSRLATRQRRGGVGAAGGASAALTASAAPYDVDAEEVEVASSGDGVVANEEEGEGVGGYISKINSGGDEDGEGVGDDARAATAAAALSDAGSMPNCAQHESRDEVASVPSQPPVALSPSCASSASHLSTILCSLRDADAPPVAVEETGEGTLIVAKDSVVQEVNDPVGSHAATGVVRNGLVAMQNISLSALSAAAELHPLAPLPPLPGGECVHRDKKEEEAGTQVTDIAEEDATEMRSPLQQHVVAAPVMEGSVADAEPLPPDAEDLVESSAPPLPESGPPRVTEAATAAAGSRAREDTETTTQEGQRHAAARRRLQEALETALRSYNAEVGDPLRAAPAPLRGGVPLRVVVHSWTAPDEDRDVPLVCWAAAPADAGVPGRRDVGTLCHLVGGSDVVARTGPADAAAVESAAEVRNGMGPALRASAEVVLSALSSTDVSARTTGRATAAPAPASLGTRATLPPLAASAALEATAATATARAAAAPSSALRAPVTCAHVERDTDDGESVGRLTAGTQRRPASPLGRHSVEAHTTPAAAGAVAPALLWVAQEDEDAENGPGDGCSAAVSRSPAPPSAAASPLLRLHSPDKHHEHHDTADEGDAEERWWAAYGIDALEYTQNGDFTTQPRARSASPAVGAASAGDDAAALRRWRQPATSPLPRVVVELSSSSAEETEEEDGAEDGEAGASQPEETLLSDGGAAAGVERGCRSAPAHSAALGEKATEALQVRGCAVVHLDPAAWPHMSNAELRRLCEEVGLRTVASAGAASPASVAEARRGQSAPLPTATPQTATITPTPPRNASPEWDAFGLPPHTSRELFHAATQPEQMPGREEDAVEGEGPAQPQPQPQHRQPQACPISASSATTTAALERESMLEALRLLSVRLRFRHAVAPLFLHRVSRLSGLPYKRVRAADLLDEGSLLTREDLQQARQRVRAEEQAEADRCIVAALAAQAAESVEQSAQLVAARWAGSAAAAAASSRPSGDELCVYERILLREPVHVEAAVAAVQSAFPHLTHTRVQQLLTANEVIAEVAGTSTSPTASTTPPRSPSPPPPLPSSPSPEEGPPAAPSALGASPDGGVGLPQSQEARQRANARRYFSQRGYMTRRGIGWGRGRGRAR